MVANGTPEDNPSFTAGSTVEFLCDLGYEFRTEESDTYSIECQDDDSWTAITDCDGKVLFIVMLDHIKELETRVRDSNSLITFGSQKIKIFGRLLVKCFT